MKEYSGAVFFVDILGVGSLTQGKAAISKEDFLAHRFSFESGFTEHQFCAKLLVKFRRILTTTTEDRVKIKVAQLSDCAFIWSEDANMVVNVAREIMWKSLLGGLLCRGGLAYGQIVEPDKINTKLGMFICGGAVTDAANLEQVGKGTRIFIKPDLVSELSSIPHTAFTPRKNPMDCSIFDEFLWYKYPDEIQSSLDDYQLDKGKILEGIVKLIAMLRYSPKFKWNSSSHAGRLQLANSIDVISSETEEIANNLDLKFGCEYVIDALDNRSDNKYKDILNSYQKIIKDVLKLSNHYSRRA